MRDVELTGVDNTTHELLKLYAERFFIKLGNGHHCASPCWTPSPMKGTRISETNKHQSHSLFGPPVTPNLLHGAEYLRFLRNLLTRKPMARAPSLPVER